MSAGDARHGRRDNGLVAAEYAAAGDVDPRVGEHLLDVLALDGIAAYLRPSTDLHPVTRSSTLPGRPTDRLYVDRTHLATARDYLARLAEEPERHTPSRPAEPGHREPSHREPSDREPAKPGPSTPGPSTPGADPADAGGADIDDEWAKIIAGFDEEAPRRSWPAAEDLPEPDPRDKNARDKDPRDKDRRDHDPHDLVDPRDLDPRESGPGNTAVLPPRRDRFEAQPITAREPSLLDGLDTFGANLPDPEEDRYVPPAPPPVPRPSAPTALAVLGIIVGLVVFLTPSLLPMDEGAAMLIGFVAVVGGFATLVWRLRPGDDDDDIDPHNGAVV